MGYFNTTLFLLRNEKNAKTFLVNFYKNLKFINLSILKDDTEIIVFNDSIENEEKENVELRKGATDLEIINMLTSWKSLGLVPHTHPDFRLPIIINFLTWNDKYINGFVLDFYGSEFNTRKGELNHKLIVLELSKLVDYEYIVGDVGNISKNFIDLEQELSSIKEIIKNKKIEIDIRRDI